MPKPPVLVLLNLLMNLLMEEAEYLAKYQAALEKLGEHGLAQCIVLIATINAWNRIAVATQLQHEEG